MDGVDKNIFNFPTVLKIIIFFFRNSYAKSQRNAVDSILLQSMLSEETDS